MMKMARDHPLLIPGGYQSMRIIWDNATWHVRALRMGLAASMGLPASAFLHQPSRSPDLNLPVERSHAVETSAASRSLVASAEIRSAQDVKDLMEEVWEGKGRKRAPALSVEGAKGMFRELARVYDEVIAAGGDYTAKRH
jgi:hypothetical protein